jgi:hypothetical protein
MAVSPIRVAVCIVSAVVVLSGSAAIDVWGWALYPGAPVAGQNMEVSIWQAPCTTVTVELWVNGVRDNATTVTNLPNFATFSIPASYRGKKYEVRVVCPGSSDSTAGTFL